MMRRRKQEVINAVGRVFPLTFRTSGSRKYPNQQCTVTIPKAIADVMLQRASHWRWTLANEGVLLSPVLLSPAETLEIPEWAQNGGSGE